MDIDGEKTFVVWLGHKKIEASYEEIKGNSVLEAELKELVHDKAENEIQFFHPHGEAKMGYDCGFQLVSMADWINDREHDFCMNCSPNRVGKTVAALVKKVLKLIPCKKAWQIFKNGIKFYDWLGPRTLVILSYNKSSLMDVIWPAIQKWIPAYELGEYRLASLGGTRSPAWDRNPRLSLRCQSKIIMLTYDQKASVCAGIAAGDILGDEQMPLAFHNELNQRDRQGGVWWDLPFTPHKVDGRPDTGSAGWLNDVWLGQKVKGHNVLRTRITVEEVPDQIYSNEQKQKAYIEHVQEPKKSGDAEAIREGQARYYGLFQRVSGLFYPEVQPDIHFVNWTYADIAKKGWTHYRSIDFGYASPTAVGFWAISPAGDFFMYDEYYVSGKDAILHAPAIIEKSGNIRVSAGKINDKETGMNYDSYSEVVVRQHYFRTWLDWHSFSTQGGTGRPISFFFHIGGLSVTESSTLRQEHRAQNTRALLRIDKFRKHMVTGKLGAPRMYISTQCVKWIWEWQRCITETRAHGNERNNPKETKRDKDDHLIDQMEYLACASPRYMGDYASHKTKEFKTISKHGGY